MNDNLYTLQQSNLLNASYAFLALDGSSMQRCPLGSHCELWSACELFPSNSSHLVRISLNSSLFARVSCMQTIADVTRILFIGAEPVVFRADSAALLQSSAPHAYINIYSFYTVFLPYIFLWLKNELCIAVTLLLDAL